MKQYTPKPEPKSARGNEAETIKRLFSFGLSAVYDKSPAALPKADQHQLNALRLFYGYRHNGFVLAEALELCTRRTVNPPAWVLMSLNEGFQRFLAGNVTLNRALALEKRDREEYEQYRAQQDMMSAIRKRINKDPKRKIAPACHAVAGGFGWTADAAEKAYRKFWKGFYDHVSGGKTA